MKGKYKSNTMDNKVELELEVTTAAAKGAFLFLQEHLFHDFLQRRPTKYAARLAELKLSPPDQEGKV